MANKTYLQSDLTDTVIAQDVHIKGDLVSDNDISIDGHVEGNITTKAALILGVNAKVIGDIAARTVRIAGTVEGSVSADESLACADTAHIKGDINAADLVVESGAVLMGKVTMPADTPVVNQEE